MTQRKRIDSDRDQPQVERFRKAAREHETDDSEEAFDAMVKKIAKAPQPKPDGPAKSK